MPPGMEACRAAMEELERQMGTAKMQRRKRLQQAFALTMRRAEDAR